MGQNIIVVNRYKSRSLKDRRFASAGKAYAKLKDKAAPNNASSKKRTVMTSCPQCGCAVGVEKLEKHGQKCPKRRIDAEQASVRSTTAIPIEDAPESLRKAIKTQYSRLVEEYNRECKRLAEMRAKIDLMASFIARWHNKTS